jgi:hypothetical protein
VILPLVAWAMLVFPCWAEPNRLNLVEDPSQWSVGIDRGGTKMSPAKADGGLAVDVIADGREEDFPKARFGFSAPQDWHAYSRINLRLRVVCTDPSVRRKSIALVFYDEKTRLPDYPGKPMRQQSISHTVPVNRWMELSDWLAPIHRSAIRQLDLYLYETPPDKAHQYRWEVNKLELESVCGEAVAFDSQVFGRNEIRGALGKPAGSVKTQDGLQLAIGGEGEIVQVSVDGKNVGAASPNCPTGLLVRDVTRPTPPVMVGGRVEQAGNEVKQTAELRDLGLAVKAAYRTHPGYAEIAGSVADLRGQDRAVTVYLALPVVEGPWQWWDNVAASRTEAAESMELSYLESGMGYGLGGCHSKYPLGAVTLPASAGLTLAIRMDEPVVHRVVYNPRLRIFYLAIDFGLVPERRADGRPLSESPFRILLYRHDAAWGFRSALNRYYELFPEFFAKRATREGGWFVWGDMSKTEGALDAGFGFHWGPSGANAVKWDNAHGSLALFYVEPQTYQQTMEDFDREPSTEETLQRLQKLVQGDPQELAKVAAQPYRVYPLGPSQDNPAGSIQATAQAVAKSLNYDITGQPHCFVAQLDWMSKSRWGAILSCNLVPGIPDGKGQLNLRQIIAPSLESMEKQGARYDGIGLDSLGGYGEHAAANYRREHFRYGKFPLSFSALDHQPIQVAAFTTVEWVRELAKEMHGQGKVLMANCSWGFTPGWLTFAAPYLDVFGAEATEFADPDFIRAIAYRKPCTDLPYKPRPAWEVPRHWLHAIHPGHGNDLAAMRQSVGLLRDLITAGWEPITGARVTPEQVRVERYGSGRRVYLVLHNPTEQPTPARVPLDRGVLGAQAFAASVQPAGRNVEVKDGCLEVPLAAKETVLVVLSRP